MGMSGQVSHDDEPRFTTERREPFTPVTPVKGLTIVLTYKPYMNSMVNDVVRFKQVQPAPGALRHGHTPRHKSPRPQGFAPSRQRDTSNGASHAGAAHHRSYSPGTRSPALAYPASSSTDLRARGSPDDHNSSTPEVVDTSPGALRGSDARRRCGSGRRSGPRLSGLPVPNPGRPRHPEAGGRRSRRPRSVRARGAGAAPRCHLRCGHTSGPGCTSDRRVR